MEDWLYDHFWGGLAVILASVVVVGALAVVLIMVGIAKPISETSCNQRDEQLGVEGQCSVRHNE